MRIYFGLGSNLGDRLKNLRNAVDRLKTLGRVIKASSIYETAAWGGVAQPDYLNACVLIERERDGDITPIELLHTVKTFEHELGRVPSERWGARKIDIDILLIDGIIYESQELVIPHINMPDRLFVLMPLREILASEWRHPVNHKTVNDMIESCINQPVQNTHLEL